MTTTSDQRAATPPSELRRTTPFTLVRDAGETTDDGLTLDGYAAVFNRQTVIDSWEGRFKEQIAPGAMKRSFRETPPRIQFDHGQHPMIGSIPIAAPRDGYPREEVDPALAPEGGAHIIARLHDNWLIQPVRDAIASGTVDGMSFRFSVLEEQWHDADGKRITDGRVLEDILRRSWMEELPVEELAVRTLKQVRVPELGPVVWPAYEETSVSVRSQVIDLSRLDDPETRKTLARAVFLADAAEASTRDNDAQRDTTTAAPHVTESTDTQRTTDTSPAGEHESPSADSRRRRDRLRTGARHHAGYLNLLTESA